GGGAGRRGTGAVVGGEADGLLGRWRGTDELLGRSGVRRCRVRTWARSERRTLKMCLVQLRAATPNRSTPAQTARTSQQRSRGTRDEVKKSFRIRRAPY